MLRSFILLLLCCALFQGCAGQTASVVPAESAPSAEAAAAPASPAGPEAGTSAAASSSPGSGGDDDDYYNDFADLYGDDAAFTPVPDPFEAWNRFWFGFNDVALRHVIKPIYQGWVFITPQEVRSGIGNFFHNLTMPIRFFNCLFQGKFNEAGVELSAFIINTVVGLGGTIDVASRHEEVQALDRDEDFGQTLGVWGAGEGAYIVWPLLGPSNARDTIGFIADFFMDPTLYMGLQPYLTIGTGMHRFNSIGDSIAAYETITDAAIEPYSALRDAYTQSRRAQIEK